MYDRNMIEKFSLHSPSISTKKGFTLIELLVVISVIAVLTTLLMVNFIGIRQRGRDGQRKSNLYSVLSALELYRADNGTYPLTNEFPECGESLEAGGAIYMQEIPCDPLPELEYRYVSADGMTYTLTACLENQNDAEKDSEDQYSASGCTTPSSFTLTNP